MYSVSLKISRRKYGEKVYTHLFERRAAQDKNKQQNISFTNYHKMKYYIVEKTFNVFSTRICITKTNGRDCEHTAENAHSFARSLTLFPCN